VELHAPTHRLLSLPYPCMVIKLFLVIITYFFQCKTLFLFAMQFALHYD